MKWPWSKPEVRSSSYADTVISRIMASAGASSDGSALAALETAARIWGAGLSSATLKPENNLALRSVSPVVLDAVGRGLCRVGESLHAISVVNGQVSLTPCGSWTVLGSEDPSTWTYRINLAGPSTSRTITLPADSVLHVKYSPHPSRPWAGRSPLQMASDTGLAAARLEKATSEELNFTQSQMLTPRRSSGDYGMADSLNPEAIQKIVDAFASHVHTGAFILPSDVVPQRLGPEPPQAFAELRVLFENSIYAACGIPPSLLSSTGNAGAMRESFRQVLHALLKPLGAILGAELREKLHPDAELSFDSLRAGDVVGTARALGSLVKAGLSPQAAAAIVGITADEVEVSP